MMASRQIPSLHFCCMVGKHLKLRTIKLHFFIMFAASCSIACLRHSPAPVLQPNTSAIGVWTATTNDMVGARAIPGVDPGIESIVHPAIRINEDSTFTLSQGMTFNGHWKQNGAGVTLSIESMDLPSKNSSTQKVPTVMKLALSKDGKTLSQIGPRGLIFHRGAR